MQSAGVLKRAGHASGQSGSLHFRYAESWFLWHVRAAGVVGLRAQFSAGTMGSLPPWGALKSVYRMDSLSRTDEFYGVRTDRNIKTCRCSRTPSPILPQSEIQTPVKI